MQKKVGVLYDNISGNVGDVAIGLSVRKILRDIKVPFEELVPGRFNPNDYRSLIIGGGHLLRPAPDFFYDKFRIPGKHILNTCGILGFPDDLHYLDEYNYVTVRSTGDRNKIQYLQKKVNVVPCTSMLLRDLERAPYHVRGPSIGIHLGPGIGFLNSQSEDTLIQYLSSLKLNAYFLPITHYMHDFDHLNRLNARLRGSKVIPVMSAKQTLGIIGKFDYFVTSSLHGAMFAYVQNIPFIALDLEKIRFFMEDRGLEQYLFRDVDALKNGLETLLSNRPDYSDKVTRDRSVLRRHVDHIKGILSSSSISSPTAGERSRKKDSDLAMETSVQLHYLQLQNMTLAAQVRRNLERERAKAEELAAQTSELHTVKEQLQHLEDEKGRLTNQLSSEAEELTARTSELYAAREELQHVEAEKTKLTSELSALVHETDRLRSRLNHTQVEIDEVKRSFGYKFMRFYASRIDRLLPDGTRRGEFRKTVVQSLKIATDEGISSLLRQIREKVERREFRLSETGPIRKIEQLPIVPSKDSKLGDRPAKQQVLLCCDKPTLSTTGTVRVPNCLLIEGWALSHKGIRAVSVYLDQVLVGPASYGISRPDVQAAFPNFPNSHVSGFRKLLVHGDESERKLHRIRIVAESNDNSSAMVEGVVEFAGIAPVETVAHKGTEDKELTDAYLSVVILTRSPPADFEQTLERIRSQDVSNVEIIIVNSGTEDISTLAAKYGASVYQISSKDFNHGETRNHGARETAGDYVCFLTDDAIPANKHLFSDMIRALRSEEKVAAVTARQIPRADADLMACYSIWEYYQALGLDSDRIVAAQNPSSLNPKEKRSVCQIDDVCSCFKKDVFLRYGYTRTAYAEDLELGIKLVNDGYKIAQLFSNGVIHSHNRHPSYYLRRAYVDTKALSELFDNDPSGSKLDDVSSLDDLLDCIFDVYESLCLAVDELKAQGFYGATIAPSIQAIGNKLASCSEPRTPPRNTDKDLSEALSQIAGIVHHTRSYRSGPSLLRQGYMVSLNNLERWLSTTHRDLVDTEDELVQALYKLLGVQIGAYLGKYRVSSRLTSREGARFDQLDKSLSEGV